jgi:hypothetical protein
MIRLRRFTALSVTILALPAAANAAVTCPAQPTLNAWAGSAKVLTMTPCSGTNGAVVYAVVAPLAAKGTASAPAADGRFTFTATFNPSGADPTGADTVEITATDGDGPGGAATVPVPITIGPAPVVDTTFTAPDLQPDATLQDGRRTFDVFYKTNVTATANLSDPTAAAPLAAFGVRFRSGRGVNRTANTNTFGDARFSFRPLVTDQYAFDVPALKGTFSDGFVFWVAPDWKIAKRFPVKNKKFVIGGRLLAGKSARTKGSYVQFQRRKGTKWLVVVRKVAVAANMTFSVRVSRAAFSGKTVRFRYVSKNADYIGSSFKFTITAPKPRLRAWAGPATAGATARALHR